MRTRVTRLTGGFEPKVPAAVNKRLL
jgi:hypothetical protein